MRLNRGDSFRNNHKPSVVVFIAPKRQVISELKRFKDVLYRSRWEILGIFGFDDTVDKNVFRAADLIITLGGDGTILYVARLLGDMSVPILGINFGRIGLLTELNIEEFYENMHRIEKGEYRLAKMHRLVAEIDGREYTPALNEYVIMTKKPGKVIGFRLYLNGEEVGGAISDGVIVSTPLGSSSYSLSAGGPLLYESLDALVITPLAPLFRAMYPLVVPSNFEVAVEVLGRWSSAVLISDGNIIQEIEPDTVVKFRKAKNFVYFVRFKPVCSRLGRVLAMIDLTKRGRFF